MDQEKMREENASVDSEAERDSRSILSEKYLAGEQQPKQNRDHEEGKEHSSYLSPIRSTSRNPPRSRPQTLHKVRSERSYGGEDGYSCFREEVQDPEAGPEDDEEKRFEVKFDGDNDPLNPRNRRKSQKWIIVMIMASSALCV
jgi:hypothetical protein